LVRRGLSRVQFITAGSALLAACSGAQTGIVPNMLKSGNSQSLPQSTSANLPNSSGLIVSSSKDNRAIATHAAGELVLSVVVGERYVRFTGANGAYVFPKQLPNHTGWFRVTNGAKFRAKTFKSGKHGIMSVDPKGNRLLFHVTPGGNLRIRDAHGHTIKQALNFDPTTPSANAEASTPNLEALNALSLLVNKPGTWTGDDDFSSIESSYVGNADLVIGRTGRTMRAKAAARAHVLDDGGGDGDFGDYVRGGDGDGDGDGDCGITMSGNLSMQCAFDLGALAAAVLGVGVGAGGAVANCFTPAGAFSLGSLCLASVALLAASSTGVANAFRAYTSTDNCPVPTSTC
jgi:hypothetical protein